MIADVRAEPDDGAELLTQLLLGEPAVPVRTAGGWTLVTAPWQPSSRDPAGYPGWVRSVPVPGPGAGTGPGTEATGSADRIEIARGFLGVPYVWGGLTDAGIDCSGLVHLAARRTGLRVPRDAHDQAAALPRVDPDDAVPGDLLFFARPGARVHHVGLTTASGRMLHASDSAHEVVEEELDRGRLATLVSACRLR